MGGKKPIGEHPSRGHLQRRFTSITRRGGHTHRGYFDLRYPPTYDDNEYNVPVIQEFSLFSEFDISPDRFGILSNDNSKGKEDDDEILKNSKVETVTPFESGISENIFQTTASTSSSSSLPSTVGTSSVLDNSSTSQSLPYGSASPQNHIEMLQMTVYHLTAALERLEFQFYAAMNNLYCYGLPIQQQAPPDDISQATQAPSSSENKSLQTDESNSNLMKRINERLSTLEGRQKIIQGKISQLDNLYGQTTQAWGRTIREMMKGNLPHCTPPMGEMKEDNKDVDYESNLQKVTKSPKNESNSMDSAKHHPITTMNMNIPPEESPPSTKKRTSPTLSVP